MVTLDSSQQAILGGIVAPCKVSIVGAAGTGKTRLLHALVAREAAAGKRIAVITPDRRAANSLRNSLAVELGSMSTSVSVQSLVGFAYSIVSMHAQAVGRKAPELISGPEEDAILAEILADPDTAIEFPAFVDAECRMQRAFRAELRDLITRASELGIGAENLVMLGREYGESMWVAGGQIMRLYEEVLAAHDALAGSSEAPDRLDHAHLMGTAASVLGAWSESAHGFPRPSWDWVVIDDLQNAPLSVMRLIRELSSDGASIVTAGNPDAAVQGFRGGVASLPGDLRSDGFRVEILAFSHRIASGVAPIVARVTSATRVAGGMAAQRSAQRASECGEIPGLYFGGSTRSIHAKSFAHAEEEAAGIAAMLREAHAQGVAYSDMAIVTRSRAMHAGLRASLVRREIPVEKVVSEHALRDETAVAALIALIRCALGDIAVSTSMLGEVVTGPLIGIDALRYRQLGRRLRGLEAVQGGNRTERELLAAVVLGGESASFEGIEELAAAASIIESIRKTARKSERQVEEVLWSAWDSCVIAEKWRVQALGRGIEADAANADLDAVLQLFRVAQRIADRDPRATIDQLLVELDAHDLPEDSIARAGAHVDEVCLTTPNASMGREWQLVVIAGLQDGLWPNMRIRDSLTHTGRLAHILTGRDVPHVAPEDMRAELFEEILDDELRQFNHALSRAGRCVVLTCVDSDDALPSRFFSFMGFVKESECEEQAEVMSGGELILEAPKHVPDPLDPAQLVAALRREGSPRAVELLQELAEHGVMQSEHERWCDSLTWTSHSGLPSDQKVWLSPSRVETFEQCPLRGFLGYIGAESSEKATAASRGTLVHLLAERYVTGETEGIFDAFEAEWTKIASADDPVANQIEHAQALIAVENLKAYLDAKSNLIDAAAEITVAAEFPENVVVAGRIDRLETFTDGKKRIVDFKTGSVMSVPEAESNAQLQMYQVALNETAVDSANLVYLKTRSAKTGLPAERKQKALGAAQHEEALKRIAAAGKAMRGGTFAANFDAKVCRTCAFVKLCPAQAEGRMFS